MCDCSAEGGTRLGCVRGTLGAICFIARLPPWSPYCALPPGPRSPSMLHPYLSRRAPLPYLGSGPWRLLRIQVCVRALLARWSGARLCSGEVGPGGLPRVGYRGRVPAGYPTSLAYTVVPAAAPPDQCLGYSVRFRPTRNDQQQAFPCRLGCKLGGVPHVGSLQACTPGGPARSLEATHHPYPPACMRLLAVEGGRVALTRGNPGHIQGLDPSPHARHWSSLHPPLTAPTLAGTGKA